MADFNGFENNFEQPAFGDVDPAAEFLAREQDDLAGIDDEGFVTSSNHVEVSDDFEDLGNVPDVVEVEMNGMPEPQPTIVPTATKPVAREEPEKIRKWREEQQIRLEQKDIEEEKKKDELKQNAQHELEEWYRHHAEQVEKTQKQNREASKNAEKEYVMERDAEVQGQEWERIAKLCDFNPKTSKATKDVSRMRSIVLQLKQNPPCRN